MTDLALRKTDLPNRWTEVYPLLQFFGLAYLIGWAPIPLLNWLAVDTGLESWAELNRLAESNALDGYNLPVSSWAVYAITRLQDFAFSLSGLVIITRLHGRSGLRVLGARLLKWRMPAICWLVVAIPLGLYLIATLMSGAFNSFQWSAGQLSRSLFSLEAGLLVTLLMRGPMGEELGLRGFALPHLQRMTSPFRASLIIGLLWAFWHLPVLAGQDPVTLIAFLLLALLLSFVFTWLFNNSGGSLVGVLLFHAFQNNEETFEVFFTVLADSNWELFSTLGLLVVSLGFAVSIWRSKGNGITNEPSEEHSAAARG